MITKVLKKRNIFIAFLYDLCVIPAAWLGAYWLRFDLHTIPPHFFHQACLALPGVVIVQAIICWGYGLYRGVWRFASIPDLTRIAKASLVGMLAILISFFFLKNEVELPRAVPLLYAILLMGGFSGARAAFRWLKDYRHAFAHGKKVLIVGAGNAGEGLIRDLMRHAKHLYYPVAIVDDNPIKLNRDIHGITVVGTCDDIEHCVEKYDIDLIMVAMPSATAAQMRRIVSCCDNAKVPYRTLPALGDIAEGNVDIQHLREVALEDLLGREQVQMDWVSLSSQFENKVVLIVGGGGSIGSELCRQVAQFSLSCMIIVDHHEYNLYAIEMELKSKFPYLNLICLLQSVLDVQGLQAIFSKYRPHIVFHAAAYKHVPLLESQSRAAIINNVVGTKNLAETSVQYGVEKFILISTDKAVNPTNLMGATKRVAEIFCQGLNALTATEFVTVRFGNVLNSAGSVVPLFRKQLRDGGPLTVTHPEITRFFMSIPEASQLIMQASCMGRGGEIFVLDMGEPIKIKYLAEQMIRLAGKTPGEEIEIIYTGLRPGEKLFEELFHKNEILYKTTHPKIMQSEARKVDWNAWLKMLDELQVLCVAEAESVLLVQYMMILVPEYQSNVITNL